MHILAITIAILFLLSTISVTLGVLFYLIQFPTGYGDTVLDLTDFLDRLIVVLAVAARLNVSNPIVYRRAIILTFHTVFDQRWCRGLASLDALDRQPLRPGRPVDLYVRKR